MNRVLVFDPCLNAQWAVRLHAPGCEAVYRGQRRSAVVVTDPDEVDAELEDLRERGYECDPCPCLNERS